MLLVAEPILGPEEKAALSDVIDSGWITMGERVQQFEKAFAEVHRTEDSVAVSSCTAGLHLILLALGLGPGDEVLVPGLTFVATANCVLYVGATPVFVDIESNDLPLMSLDDAAAKCTERTKAIILVHYAGYLPDRAKWRNFADRRGLMLIEDAAHATGLPEAGTYGVAAAFSFYGNKNMTTAEGGAVIAGDDALRARIRQLRGHGLTSGTFQRVSNPTLTYDVTMLGYNYRMDELRAALGLVQLRYLHVWNARRKSLSELYRKLLAKYAPGVTVPFLDERNSAYHIMPVVLPEWASRQDVILGLRQNGVQTTIHYPPVHHLAIYKEQYPLVKLPKTEDYATRELTLPLHPRLEDEHIEKIVQSLANVVCR
jgi:dTDP-4-amino-4,6-dideoxygalactose transaminase